MACRHGTRPGNDLLTQAWGRATGPYRTQEEQHMSKGTTRRGVRIEDELWNAAQGKAAANGDNISDIIRQALRDYLGELHEPRP